MSISCPLGSAIREENLSAGHRKGWGIGRWDRRSRLAPPRARGHQPRALSTSGARPDRPACETSPCMIGPSRYQGGRLGFAVPFFSFLPQRPHRPTEVVTVHREVRHGFMYLPVLREAVGLEYLPPVAVAVGSVVPLHERCTVAGVPGVTTGKPRPDRLAQRMSHETEPDRASSSHRFHRRKHAEKRTPPGFCS